MWRSRLLVMVAAFLVAAGAAALGSIAANVATGSAVTWWPSWLPSMDHHFSWWLVGSVVAVTGSGLFTWWAQRRYELGLVELVPAQQQPEPWVVDRPAEVRQIVQAVLRRRGPGTVGITTAVHGAGGFGKTTVARLVRADRRVLRRFDGRVYWVTLGRDVSRGGLVEKVNDLLKRIDPGRAQPFTDVRQAAEHLAAVLAEGPRRLLVLDDVWFDDQLAAFPVAGRCARLVTTRIPSLVAGQAIPVRVDQMSPQQARRMLRADLPGLPAAIVEALLVETGRWPLLLRLTNRNLLAQAQSHTDLTVIAESLLQRLRRDGPVRAAGQLPGVDVRQLNVDDPDQRSKAVAATIDASTGLLTDVDRARLTELAIFVEDETIPGTLVTTLWQATGGLDEGQTRTLCARLADLALLTLIPTRTGGTISLHDVVRDYLHKQLGNRVPRVHQTLLDMVAAGLPRAPAPVGTESGHNEVVAWWALPEEARYLREHLIEHLLAADRDTDAEAVAIDLRWVQARLHETGPAGPFADLSQVTTPRATRLARLFGQTAHLLTPTDPPHSLTDVLYSRADHDSDWGPQAHALADQYTHPQLRNIWALPDLPNPATRRVLTGHTDAVFAMAIAPDGTWLATASMDRTVRVWDAVTGAQRAKLSGHAGPVFAVAIAPDGTWLVTAGDDGTVRVWDPSTGAQRALLTRATRPVRAVAVAPDGTWIASASFDRTVRIWDAVTGAQVAKLSGHADPVRAVAVAPDGTWIASASSDRTVRIWEAATGDQRAALNGHAGPVRAVVIAPDGTWIASAGDDRKVRIWDPATDTQRAALAGHRGLVRAVAVAPDGTWIASAGDDRKVRIWDPATDTQRAVLTGHTGSVRAVVIAPDGTWLATASGDWTVRIWNPSTGAQRTKLTRHTGPVHAVAVAPDGTWIASGGDDRVVRIWDPVTGVQRAVLTGHTGPVSAVAVWSDGTRLVSAGGDGMVRIWDVVTGAERAVLTGHTGGVFAVAVAPDGNWIATAGSDATVRIWNPVSGSCAALMRVELPVLCCTWDPTSHRVTVGGRAGLYRFELKAPNS